MRKLTLSRDVLVELGSDELAAVAVAGAANTLRDLRECLSGVLRCNTADTFCEFSQGCG